MLIDTDSISTPRWGARVVIWGPPGSGKDETTAYVVRQDIVKNCSGFQLQSWIQASNDDIFQRQLRQVALISIPTCAEFVPTSVVFVPLCAEFISLLS